MAVMANSKDESMQEAKGNDASSPRLTVDWEQYAEYLAESDLSEEEKREFIQTLWYIVVSFVDLGFGVSTTQLAQDARQTDKQLKAMGDGLPFGLKPPHHQQPEETRP